jgi:DNA repair exonuclease SbcCD ATPase subunit
MQIGEQQTLMERRGALESELSQKLNVWLVNDAQISSAAEMAEDAEETVLSRAQTLLTLCAQYQTLADEKAANARQRSELREQIAVCDAHCTQILKGYFSDSAMTAEEGLQIIRTREAAYAEEINRLRDAQRQFGAFLSEHGMTEEALTDALRTQRIAPQPSSQPEHTVSVLEQQIREKTGLRAEVMQKANHASEIGAELAALRAQIQKTEQMRTEVQRALSVIRTAQSCLEQAKTAQSTRYLSYMQTRFRVYYSRLTGMTEKEAEGLSLDASFAVQAEILGAWRDMAYFSRGMQDCMNFCVRLAMIDAMYTDGGRKKNGYLPPLLLDDPFVNLDEGHLAAAKELLTEIAERFQILYFVCHESRI